MGMKISTEKTETQYFGKTQQTVKVVVDRQQLKQTDNFVYLGGNINSGAGLSEDIKRRINLAQGIMQALTNLWSTPIVSKTTKVQVYETLVLSVLLYNSETWVVKEEDKRRLLTFEMSCLRRIEGVTRRDRIRNEEIRTRLKVQANIVTKVQHKRLRYFGHVIRMKDERYPKIALYGRVHGSRGRGRPKKRWIDVIQTDCLEWGTTITEATRAKSDKSRLEEVRWWAAIVCDCIITALSRSRSYQSIMSMNIYPH